MEFLKFLRLLFLDTRGWTTEMNITGVSDIDAVIPEFWAEGIMADGNRDSFWGAMVGKEGSRMPIMDKTGPLKQSGDKITFSVIEQLMGTGVTGENVLKGNEEKLVVGTFTVTADIVRQAVAISRKSTKQANFDEVARAKELLKDWFGRKLDGDIFTTINDSSAVDTIYANDKSSEATLNATDADYFGPTELRRLRLALIRQGAIPISMEKVNGRPQPVYGCVFSEIEEERLYSNSTFTQTIREAWERATAKSMHPLLRGAIGVYGNMILYPYYGVLGIPQGTALRPETTLSATLVTATTDFAYVGVAANSNTKANYTLYFASSGSLQIESEIISYTGKTISTFTGLSRGVSSTTAAQHAAGKLVTQRDVSTVIGFGAEAICRAFPEQSETIGESDDYKEQIGIGIRAFYGHAVRKDSRRGKAFNLVKMKVFSKNPGTV